MKASPPKAGVSHPDGDGETTITWQDKCIPVFDNEVFEAGEAEEFFDHLVRDDSVLDNYKLRPV